MTHPNCAVSIVIVCLLLLFSFSIEIVGQTAARPDRGVQPQGTYAVSDIENINLRNGNVSLSIPLASLPPMAGGKLSWTLRAVYNSKLWDAKKEERQDNPYEPIYVASVPQISENGGWGLGTYRLKVQLATDDYAYIASSQDPEYQSLLLPWAKFTLDTPDGASHEVRPLDYLPYQGSHDYLEGYFKDGPNNVGSPMRYYSFDGSFLWVKVNPSSYSTSWEAYLPNGTKVVQLRFSTHRPSIFTNTLTTIRCLTLTLMAIRAGDLNRFLATDAIRFGRTSTIQMMLPTSMCSTGMGDVR